MAKEAVLETVLMTYGEDGILRIRINEGVTIGLEQAKLQFETIRRMCGDDRILVLVDATRSHTVTKEAQEYAAQNVGNRIATAVIASNAFSKISLNIYLSIFKPVSPFRMFMNEELATKWLKEIVATV